MAAVCRAVASCLGSKSSRVYGEYVRGADGQDRARTRGNPPGVSLGQSMSRRAAQRGTLCLRDACSLVDLSPAICREFLGRSRSCRCDSICMMTSRLLHRPWVVSQSGWGAAPPGADLFGSFQTTGEFDKSMHLANRSDPLFCGTCLKDMSTVCALGFECRCSRASYRPSMTCYSTEILLRRCTGLIVSLLV